MSSNDQTIRSSELSQLVLGGSSELPTTAAAQASNPLLFKQAKGTNSASANAHANALQDVSDMDAAQASQLLKHKHRGKQEVSGAGGGGGVTRYRRQVRRNYHDIIDSEMKEKEDHYQHRRGDESGGDQEDSTFNIRKTKAGHGKQSKAAAGAQAILDKVVKKGRSDKKTTDASSSEDDDDDEDKGRNRRRRRGRERRPSSASSSSSSSDDDSSVERRRRVRERRARSRRSNDSGSGSDSSSSNDDDDDEADQRRNRMRAKMVEKRRQQEMKMPPPKEQSRDGNGKSRGKGKGDESESESSSSEDESRGRTCVRVRVKEIDAKSIDKTDGVDSGRKPKPQSKRRSASSSNSDDSSSSSDDDDSSDSSSSSSSEESEEEEVVPLTSIAKPMFVPKHRRGKEQEEKERLSILADREEKDNARTDRRIKNSRALVAEIVAMETNQKNMNMDGTGMDDEEGGDEFANGSSTLVPPNDSDDVDITGIDEGGKEFEQKAWEVRELLRLLRDFEEIKLKEQEIEERERRRNMTDEERYEEDVKAGKYRKPGEQRQNGTGSAAMAQNQRYFHRGAFYMDEDTLQDKDDIRHRAAEYAQAATGDIIFDKSKMPKVMQQSKQFGLAGNTRYKGLAKEDTSTRDSNYLPIYKGKKRSREGDQTNWS